MLFSKHPINQTNILQNDMGTEAMCYSERNFVTKVIFFGTSSNKGTEIIFLSMGFFPPQMLLMVFFFHNIMFFSHGCYHLHDCNLT